VKLPAALALACLLADPAGAAAPPRRVASLNLTADEVLVELVPPERLVSVTLFADEKGTSNVLGRVPPHVPRLKADVERLVALAPDVVVVSEYTDADFLKLLERSGIRTHRMAGLSTLDGYRNAILELGRVVGEPARAEQLVARYDRVLSDLARKLAGVKRPRVLYWASGLTAGDGTAIGSLIECGGGANVGRELGLTSIAPVGAERAFVADPDVLLVGVYPGARDGVAKHPLLSRSRAVTQGRIVEMPTELLVALSHYAADACWHLASRLHPDRVTTPRP
jgi:iron complex transport system substrate-binding protein